MKIRFTPSFLKKLEALIEKGGFKLRYEKGNFKSGYCILKNQGVIVVNQYYPLEGKVNCLISIIQNLDWQSLDFDENEEKLFTAIRSYVLE